MPAWYHEWPWLETFGTFSNSGGNHIGFSSHNCTWTVQIYSLSGQVKWPWCSGTLKIFMPPIKRNLGGRSILPEGKLWVWVWKYEKRYIEICKKNILQWSCRFSVSSGQLQSNNFFYAESKWCTYPFQNY